MHPGRASFLVLLLFAAAGCADSAPSADAGITVDTLPNGAVHVRNGTEGLWAANGSEPWGLEEDLRIGRIDGTGPDVFGSARNIIPDAEGRIWVMDGQAHELRLFDRNGEFVRSVGGSGDGPGEFGFNPCARRAVDGEIWVEAGGRWTRFDSEGELLSTQPTTGTLGCGISAWRDRQFLGILSTFDSETREFDNSILVHDFVDGRLVPRDTIPMPPSEDYESFTWTGANGRATIVRRVPLTKRPRSLLRDDGGFWVVDASPDYRIVLATLELDTTRIIERAYEPVTVPDSVREEVIANLTEGDRGYPEDWDANRIPRTFPPFEQIHLATNGGLWVQRQIEGGAWAFDVFDPEGRYLGEVPIPIDMDGSYVQHIDDDYAYLRASDEFDVSYVVRLRIVRPR